MMSATKIACLLLIFYYPPLSVLYHNRSLILAYVTEHKWQANIILWSVTKRLFSALKTQTLSKCPGQKVESTRAQVWNNQIYKSNNFCAGISLL